MYSPRRWRQLAILVSIWVVGAWYFLSGSNSFFAGVPQRAGSEQDDASRKLDQLTWSKLPERYPLSSIRPLPTGKAEYPIPHVQASPPEENADARGLRQKRLAAIKESFVHSWAGYKKYGWLRDEVTPVTGTWKDPFGGWAATLVDALDTLWIMGLKDEFALAVTACESIDFTRTEARTINVFETTIRYLGGFLAAYEISGKQYPGLLRKAIEVAEILMCAFDTPGNMPITRWDWRSYMTGEAQSSPKSVLSAELGSLNLEFTKLSQLTGDMKYYHVTQRISDLFEESQNGTFLPGMWGISVDAGTPDFGFDKTFTLGAMADSLYEYFPKQYLLLGGALDQPRKMYEGFIEVAKKHLFRRVLNPEDRPLLLSGNARVSRKGDGLEVGFVPAGQHLTCFVGGMVGLGSRIFNRPDDLDIAAQLTDGCVYTYESTPSGIGPEVYDFAECGGIDNAQLGESCKWTKTKWRTAVEEHYRTIFMPDSPVLVDEFVAERRLPLGIIGINDARYMLRPEAIESVWYMYRITGDSKWAEKAWRMFEAVEAHTRTKVAAAAILDVTEDEPLKLDSMESFWLAETLKYYYLVFAEWDVVSLDEWVLNTEAHPFRRADA